MNKKFSYYYRSGWYDASISLKGRSLRDRVVLFLYLLTSMIGKLFIFTRPIFSIADHNLAAMMSEGLNFSIEKAFEGATNKEKYWQLLFAYLISDLFIFVGVIVLLSPVAAFWALFQQQSGQYGDQGILLSFGIPFSAFFGFLALLYIILICIFTKPMACIARKTDGFDSSDLIYNSKQGLQTRGKTTLFFLDFLYDFFVLLYIFLGFGLVLIMFLGTGYASGTIFGVLLGFVILLSGLYLIPNLQCAKRCSEYVLFSDTVSLKKTIVVKPLSGKPGSYVPLFESNHADSSTSDSTRQSNTFEERT